jgi:hypothetical protein
MKLALALTVGTEMQDETCPVKREQIKRIPRMDKPRVDFKEDNQQAFYAFVGRVSLQLVDHNADAITVANFLREITEADRQTLTPEQALAIAQNYVDIATTCLEPSPASGLRTQ